MYEKETVTVTEETGTGQNIPEANVPEKHPADELMEAMQSRYSKAPVFMLADPLAVDGNEDLSMIHVIEQAVNFMQQSGRVSKDSLARVAHWFNDKYGSAA